MNKKKRLQSELPLLKLIVNLEEPQREALLRSLDCSKCESIYDCLHNALTNKTLDADWRNEAKSRLRGQEKKLRLLLKKEVPKQKKHKALIQVGGNNISYILQHIVPMLEEYLKQ